MAKLAVFSSGLGRLNPGIAQVMKRALDLTAGLFLLIALLPVMVLLCGWIKLNSPGPAIIWQERLGRRGLKFNCYKFRTMFKEADSLLEEYLFNNKEAKKQWDRYQKLKSFDPRLTGPGRFLRRFSLDELPQLVNVINGEMSLVGPRPYLPAELKQLGAHQEKIQTCRPGLTGLWQVSGRNNITFTGRLALDRWYAENLSFGLDLRILAKTIVAVIGGDGAY